MGNYLAKKYFAGGYIADAYFGRTVLTAPAALDFGLEGWGPDPSNVIAVQGSAPTTAQQAILDLVDQGDYWRSTNTDPRFTVVPQPGLAATHTVASGTPIGTYTLTGEVFDLSAGVWVPFAYDKPVGVDAFIITGFVNGADASLTMIDPRTPAALTVGGVDQGPLTPLGGGEYTFMVTRSQGVITLRSGVEYPACVTF